MSVGHENDWWFKGFLMWLSLKENSNTSSTKPQIPRTIVFCYQNCSDLQWENVLKSKADGREFAKDLISLEQFDLTVKGQNNFW